MLTEALTSSRTKARRVLSGERKRSKRRRRRRKRKRYIRPWIIL